MAEVLINGCRLIVHSERKTLWGDLWKIKDGPWIFVGVLDGRGNADWKRHKRMNPIEKTLHVGTDAPWFEKRGIVVIPEHASVFLNQWARDYIARFHPELASMALPPHWREVVAEAEEILNGRPIQPE